MSGIVFNPVGSIPLIKFELKKMYVTNIANTFEKSKDLKWWLQNERSWHQFMNYLGSQLMEKSLLTYERRK